MIVPINCPKCNGELLNTFEDTRNGEILHKRCKNVGHIFSCRLKKNEMNLLTISIGRCHIEFGFAEKTIEMYRPPVLDTKLKLPWFEPDLSDYSALVKKLRKYIMLS